MFSFMGGERGISEAFFFVLHSRRKGGFLILLNRRLVEYGIAWGYMVGFDEEREGGKGKVPLPSVDIGLYL